MISCHKPNVFVVDLSNNVAGIPWDGNTPVTFTYIFDLANYVLAILSLDEWPEESRVIGDELTWNEFVTLAEEVKGLQNYPILILHRNLLIIPRPKIRGPIRRPRETEAVRDHWIAGPWSSLWWLPEEGVSVDYVNIWALHCWRELKCTQDRIAEQAFSGCLAADRKGNVEALLDMRGCYTGLSYIHGALGRGKKFTDNKNKNANKNIVCTNRPAWGLTPRQCSP